MRTIGYARCSTTDRQDIRRQERELVALGAGEVYQERAGGAVQDRPELARLLSTIQEGDTLVTTEVSRLTRSVPQLCDILKDAEARRYRLVCGTLVADYTATVDPMHRAMLLVMGVFAELERGVTVERIKSGLANARAQGARMGRPRKTKEDVPETVTALLPKYLQGDISAVEYAKAAGVSRTALYKYLRLMGCEGKPKSSSAIRAKEPRVGRPNVKVTDIPQTVKDLLPDYSAGNLTKIEYAKKAGITRPTLDKYLRVLESAEHEDHKTNS